jgi:uncharacterized repeat protein (TIGR01451 family)
MIAKLRSIGSWPFWAGFLLIALMAILLLGSTPISSQAPLTVEALQISKSVNMPSVLPGQVPAPLYTVSFTNTSMTPVALDVVTDVLPIGFEFLEMHDTSDVHDDPHDAVEPEIVWQGPIEVPGDSTLSLVYAVGVPETIEPSATPYENSVTAATDGTLVGPASAKLVVGEAEKSYAYLPLIHHNYKYPSFTVSKTANPTVVQVGTGDTVVYALDIVNEGDDPAILESVVDILPEGFVFQGMEPGSDLAANPSGTSGTITWNGPWVVPARSDFSVIYRVTPNEAPGEYINSVSVASSNALVPAEPASASVTVQPPTLLEEHFESGIGRWTKFLNYWRLTEEQWYHGQDDGVGGSGAATQNCTLGKVDPLRGAEDALLMYMGEGAESWTNYRVETKVLLRGGITETEDGDPIWILEGGYPVGLWVRGQLLELEPDKGGGNLTGYYVVLGGKPGKDMFVRLAQLQTLTDCWGLACENPQNLYDFNNPHTLTESRMDFSFERNQWYTLVVEVEGNWIRAWVNGALAIEYQDTKEPFLTGTVGLKTYKSWTVSFDDVVVTPLSD